MNRLSWGIVAIVVIAIAIIAFWWLGDGGDDETIVVERGSIDVTIETVGTVQLSDNAPVRAGTSGEVVTLGAIVGEHVESGDILVLLDDEELARGVRDAREALEEAEFALQFAELRLDEDPNSLNLQQEALTSQQRVEIARRVLEDAIEQRQAGAILATHDGLVLDILVSKGDRVSDNQPVATVLAEDDLILVADVDELDLANITPGAPARFRLDSAPAVEIEGFVVRTSPEAIQRGGATLFPTDIHFSIVPGVDIRPGMNADVTIQTELRENVLLVPERAIRTVGRRAFVTTLSNGEKNEVEVLLGYRGSGVAEVVSGLDEGQEVVLR